MHLANLSCWNFIHVCKTQKETHFVYVLFLIKVVFFGYLFSLYFLIEVKCFNNFLLYIEVRMTRVSLLDSACNYLAFVGNRMFNISLVFIMKVLYFHFLKIRQFTYKNLRYWISADARHFEFSQHVQNILYFILKQKTKSKFFRNFAQKVPYVYSS